MNLNCIVRLGLVLVFAFAEGGGSSIAAETAPFPAVTTGSPCKFVDHRGTFAVTQIESLPGYTKIHFSFRRTAGSANAWASGEDDQMNLYYGRYEADLVGEFDANAPSVGQTFPGVRREEEPGGDCPPVFYEVSIGGGSLRLRLSAPSYFYMGRWGDKPYIVK